MKEKTFCVVDIELTEEKEIIQFSAIKLNNNLKEIDKRSYYIKPHGQISTFVTELTGITESMLKDKPYFSQLAEELYNYIKDDILVCHGLKSDYAILDKSFSEQGIKYIPQFTLDTVELARLFFPCEKSYKLSDLSISLNLYDGEDFHNADIDTLVTVNLLIELRYKIAKLEHENYIKVKKILKEVDESTYYFVLFARRLRTKLNLYKRNNKFNMFAGVKFKKMFIAKTATIQKSILFSSVPESEYSSYYNLKLGNYEILKNKENYVTFDIFSLLEKKEDINLYKLKTKLYVWILETDSGDFSELNLLASEQNYLINIKNKILNSKKMYYYNMKKNNCLKKEHIITNYNSISQILGDSDFQNYNLVFEDSSILGRELNLQNNDFLLYKDVVTELNITYTINQNNKIKTIQENIDSLVLFLHEMYISQSLYLYNDSVEFIKQDIAMLKLEMEKCNDKLPITKKFITYLATTLENSSNSYKFENLDNPYSLFLKVVDEVKVKALINKIYKRKNYFVKNYFNSIPSGKIKINYVNNKNEVVGNKHFGKLLYIFQSNKYRDLYFQEREKKSYIKYINFSSSSSFSELYLDISKNNKMKYICYATKDILFYKYYLNDIFDEITILNDLEE